MKNKKDVESKLDKFENYCFIKDYVAVKRRFNHRKVERSWKIAVFHR